MDTEQTTTATETEAENIPLEEKENTIEQETSPEANTEASADVESSWDVEKARAVISKKNSENRNLRARAKEAEKQVKDLSEYKQLYETAMQKNLQMEVALETALPLELATRLNGGSKEEMLADAEKLLKLIPRNHTSVSSRPRPLDGKTKTTGQDKETTVEELTKLMFGN